MDAVHNRPVQVDVEWQGGNEDICCGDEAEGDDGEGEGEVGEDENVLLRRRGS